MFGNNNNKKSNSSIFATAGKTMVKAAVGINPIGATITAASIMSNAISEAEKAEARRQREAERRAASNSFSNGFCSGYAAAKSNNYSSYNNGYRSGYNAAKAQQKPAEPKYNSTVARSNLSRSYMEEFINSFGFVDNDTYRTIASAIMLHEDGYKTSIFKCWDTGNAVYRLAARGNEWKLYVTCIDGIGYMVLTGANIDDILCVASETEERFEEHLNYEVSHNYLMSDVAKSVFQTLRVFF